MAGRRKIGREEALHRASEDLWALIVYFNVTRPRYEGFFKRNGKLDPSVVLKSFSSLKEYDASKLSPERRRLYNIVSAKVNGTFGIPSRLVESVLGAYRDANGRKVRIQLEDVLQLLKDSGREIKVKTHGGKSIFTTQDGKRQSQRIYSYCKKYYIAKVRWLKMLVDPTYDKLENYASKSVRDKIFNWKKGTREQWT